MKIIWTEILALGKGRNFHVIMKNFHWKWSIFRFSQSYIILILNDYNTIFYYQYELKFKNLWPTTVKIFDKYIWWKLYIKCVSKRSCWNRWTLNSPAELQLKFVHLYISLKFSLVFLTKKIICWLFFFLWNTLCIYFPIEKIHIWIASQDEKNRTSSS